MEHDVHHHHQQQNMELPPGFRFHPTDEELITHYLARKAADPRFVARAVGVADLNKCEPWDLPSRATWGEKEWYFFCVKDRKYPTGLRTNRATESGYWKATGKDREIFRGKALVGMKKTLVFYTGRAPRGGKTGWVMHEYRLEGKHATNDGGAGSSSSSLFPSIKAGTSKDEWVLCRVFKKNIEPPTAASGKRSVGSSAYMEMADVGPSGSMSMSMSMAADELAAACALPPLMDASVSGGVPVSLSAVAASIDVLPPPAHVTCFSNALEAPFLMNPPFVLPSAPADHLGVASASPFLQQVMQYDGGMVHELLQQDGSGGWYGKAGERERLSGASQDTGVTSEVNPAEISSSRRQHMNSHEASLWDY